MHRECLACAHGKRASACQLGHLRLPAGVFVHSESRLFIFGIDGLVSYIHKATANPIIKFEAPTLLYKYMYIVMQ